jgi:hypothetical protein
MSAEADGPLRTLTADVIFTNSSLGAAGDGISAGDGTSMASAVTGLSLRVKTLQRGAPRLALGREGSFVLEGGDRAHLAGPAAAARFLLGRNERLPD